MTNEKISALVQSQFPAFYQEDGERFIAFVKAYYEYLEQSNKLTDRIRNLQNYKDVSTTSEEFLKYFINSFLPSFPVDVLADKRLLIKWFNKRFNESRGSVYASKLLFRALYNEDIELNYPAESILKVSTSDWRKERYLVSSYDPGVYGFIGKTIIGRSSGAQALVEDVVRKVVRGRDIVQLILSNVKGGFYHLEPISLYNNGDYLTSNFNPIVEAGINDTTIISRGGQYQPGDVVDLISSDTGNFGKAVVTSIIDLEGAVAFNLVDGGSGYVASSTTGIGTTISITGGDGTSPASFEINSSDITGTFAIAICTTLPESNTIFGANAPTIRGVKFAQLKDVPFDSPDYGYREDGELTQNANFRDHSNAVINIANTADIIVGDSLFGATSLANATVLSIVDGTAGDSWFRINGYRNFVGTENIKIQTSSGSVVGTVSSFQGNTIGYHVFSIANVAGQTISENDEIRGTTSGAIGVIKKVLSNQANGYTANTGGFDDLNLVTVQVTANTTANLTNDFDTGPLKPFEYLEPVVRVTSGTLVGNVVSAGFLGNTAVENLYSRLSDSILFETSVFGTIGKLSSVVGGSGYSIAPTVTVRNNNIAALGIGEAYITLQTDDDYWSTGNSSITTLDTNDVLYQANTGARGDVKVISNSKVQFANGTYQIVVRVWQPLLQRTPGNIQFANNQGVSLLIYDSSYVFGEVDSRSTVGTGQAKIVNIQDEGVLGENAVIGTSIGANGSITALRVIDSGFCYKDNEIVLVEAPSRNNAFNAQLRLSLGDVANSEGYYATTKGHVSSKRAYIHDNDFYQEYSYQVISPIPIDKYRDILLKLVHPAGQKFFGKFRTQSNAYLNVTSTSDFKKRTKATGTLSINNGSFSLTGSGTSFSTQFANGDLIVIEYADNQFYTMPINIVANNTIANVTISWSNTSISGANSYYLV